MARIFLSSLALLLLAPSALALADDLYHRPRQTPGGDWLTNGAPRKGQVKEHMHMPGSLWRVTSHWLNCRQSPALTAPIFYRFKRGTVLQADVGYGGSDEVLQNFTDARGKTWMHARRQNGEVLGCFVRAHASFIQPLP